LLSAPSRLMKSAICGNIHCTPQASPPVSHHVQRGRFEINLDWVLEPKSAAS
jgi:hypothetical protein